MSLTFEEFIAGWVGGIVGLVASHPLDTLKVRKQEGKSNVNNFVRLTYRQDGIYGFYKGMGIPALMSGIQNAVFFGVYANVLHGLIKLDQKRIITNGNNVMHTFVAGCSGGFVQILLTTPVESIKIQLQTKNSKGDIQIRGSLKNHILETYRTQGIRKGFFRGFIFTGIRDVPTGGFYILTYDEVDAFLQKRTNEYLSHCIAGGIAGFITYAPMTPVDVIKTKIQADSVNNPRYRNTIDCIQQTYKTEGFAVFWKGFIPVCVRAFVCNAFIFMGYEYCLNVFEKIEK